MAIGAAGGNDAQGAGRMKESNIHEPWLVDVPLDWVSSRIKNVALLSPGCSGKNPTQHELCTVLPMELLSDNGTIDIYNIQSYEDVFSGLTIFEAGDVLFAKITPCMENGKGAYVETLTTRYAFGSTEYHVLRPLHKVQGKFLYYYTKSSVFREYAAENMTGAAGQKRVSSRFLKETRLFLPPLPEQVRIAAYLDASCAAIDAAVNAKKKQIESLEHLREEIIENAVTKGIHIPVDMQMIGDEWIGEIPANWSVVRLKRIISAVDYGISESTIQEGRFLVLKMGHIQGGEIKVAKNDYVDDVSGNLLLDNGDLLFNRTNSPDQVGKAAIFRGEKSDEITFASYLVRLKTNHRADSYYFNYVLNSRGFLSFARKLAIPSVQQSNLNATRYCRMLVPLPPIEEQRSIRKFLDAKISEVSVLFSNIESQIATLIDYRKSLIHECVTGQRRINEADVAKVERTLEQAAGLPQQ